MSAAIKAFSHGNRGIGIRNHQLILPSVICSTHVSRRIATEVGGVTFAHQHGCAIIGDDVAGIDNFFIALADHPNVNSVLVIALGCETIQGQELAAKLLESNESTQYRIIQESGGVEGTVAAGVKAAKELNAAFPPKAIEATSLRIGLDVGRGVAMIDELKKRFPKMKIVIMGDHVTSFPEESMKIWKFHLDCLLMSYFSEYLRVFSH